MTDQNNLPKTLGSFSVIKEIESGWGWTLHLAEQTLESGKTRNVRLRVFLNQPKNGQLHTRLNEAKEIFKKHPHLHLQRIFKVEHITLDDRSTVLAVAEERIEPWTPPKESDYRMTMGQLLGAVEHMASVKLPGAGLSSKNLGRTTKGSAVICNLSAVWEQHWSGRSRAGDADYYRTLPPEMAEQPAEFSAPQWVWSAGVVLLDALASMRSADGTIADELDVFDSAISEYLSHSHEDYFEKQMIDLPEGIQNILKKALDHKPEERYTSLPTLRAAIEYPIRTTKSGERYVMPDTYQVGEVTVPSRKTAAQAYSLGFLIFAVAFAIILLFVLLRDPNEKIAPLTAPNIDQAEDPELVALRKKLEEETEVRSKPVVTEDPILQAVEPNSVLKAEPLPEVTSSSLPVVEEVNIPEKDEPVIEEIPSQEEASQAEEEPEALPIQISVVNQSGSEIILFSQILGVSNSLAINETWQGIWPDEQLKGELKATGNESWIYSTFTVDPETTRQFEWIIDSLTEHKAQIVLRDANTFKALKITYSDEGGEGEKVLPEDMQLLPGTYQFRLHRPDYLTIRMKVKFPYAPGLFALAVPAPERWVESSNLKKLNRWRVRSVEDPKTVLEEINQSEPLRFESPENDQQYLELKASLIKENNFETVTVSLSNKSEIILPVTFVISTDEESTKTLLPEQTMSLAPGDYVAQLIRPDYLPLQTNILVTGKAATLNVQIPEESKWIKSQKLLDLLALEKAYVEKKDARTIIFLMQGLKNVEFENSENQQRFTALRRQYYDRAID